MNTAEVIALGALIVAALGFVFNRRKDVTQSASDFARVDAQLGSIKSGVDDIRVEIRSLR